MKRIKLKPSATHEVRLSPPRSSKVSSELVRQRLGAEPFADALTRGSPFTLAALRSELAALVRSRGGRPSLEGAERRQKIPMTDGDWKSLEEAAARLAESGVTVTPGQIASQLLRTAIAKLDGREAARHELASSGLLKVSDGVTHAGQGAEYGPKGDLREWLRRAAVALEAARECLGDNPKANVPPR